jgi:rfaE bifunctional protein nucleotidyltransferase chain/domain
MQLDNPKLSALNAFLEERRRMRSRAQRLVMTNGCFDLLHTGHIFFLQKARALGDGLVVAVNSDSSVKALKGRSRPVQGELERAFALGALACVDYVVLFSEPNLTKEIAAIQPDVYTKAGDYSLGRLHGGELAALEACHAEIRFIAFLEGFSTSSLIRRITLAEGAP